MHPAGRRRLQPGSSIVNNPAEILIENRFKRKNVTKRVEVVKRLLNQLLDSIWLNSIRRRLGSYAKVVLDSKGQLPPVVPRIVRDDYLGSGSLNVPERFIEVRMIRQRNPVSPIRICHKGMIGIGHKCTAYNACTSDWFVSKTITLRVQSDIRSLLHGSLTFV